MEEKVISFACSRLGHTRCDLRYLCECLCHGVKIGVRDGCQYRKMSALTDKVDLDENFNKIK